MTVYDGANVCDLGAGYVVKISINSTLSNDLL